jgi:hypothetical protein
MHVKYKIDVDNKDGQHSYGDLMFQSTLEIIWRYLGDISRAFECNGLLDRSSATVFPFISPGPEYDGNIPGHRENKGAIFKCWASL